MSTKLKSTKEISTEYQIAIFPKNYAIEKVGEAAAKLMRLSEFDPDTVNMNPFDMNFPPEIERISIFSADKKIKLSVSPKKLAFYWINVDLKENFEFNEEKNQQLVEKVIKNLGIDKLTIQRVGLITNIIKRYPDPSKLIQENLLKNQIENTLTGAQLKLTYKAELDIYNNCNLLVTIAAGYLNDDKADRVISLQYDLNTHQDDILEWSIDEVGQFISQAKEKSETKSIYTSFFNNKAHGTRI